MTAIPEPLIETMARAAYEDMRPGTTLPPWERVEPRYQAEARKNQRAAITAVLRAGMITVNQLDSRSSS